MRKLTWMFIRLTLCFGILWRAGWNQNVVFSGGGRRDQTQTCKYLLNRLSKAQKFMRVLRSVSQLKAVRHYLYRSPNRRFGLWLRSQLGPNIENTDRLNMFCCTSLSFHSNTKTYMLSLNTWPQTYTERKYYQSNQKKVAFSWFSKFQENETHLH